ncbi:HAD-IIIA family hydrolase [Fusibacter sp. 3D3]|uniref:HAD-IIIA family hydrolase n=1 Tax=Fusibacter sp. 3D3 TaxID=1048380 RepID=UPI000852ACDE|nr:HAD-IIIA family hydrolase [Fusibacter sp. 3D3]GAU79115.1 D-glycero-D-manno-heptose 1,7-bisphosphate phosphatase [Fusibacter sp. 3D3]
MKIAFLDRDGTINRDYPDKNWKNRIEPEILQGAIEGLKGLMNLGFKIIIITNQHIINDNIISLAEYQIFTNNLNNRLKQCGVVGIDIFYCPHSETEKCNCRKPNEGMIKSAILKYPEIELDKSILIGDSKCDEDLSKRTGIKFYGINGHYFSDNYASIEAVYKEINEQMEEI